MNGEHGSISGRVVDDSGAPIGGASVLVTHSPQPQSDIAPITGADGRFRLGRLAPGSYRLAVHSANHAAAAADVEVGGGQQAEVEIRVHG
jgi:hypothetical protein